MGLTHSHDSAEERPRKWERDAPKFQGWTQQLFVIWPRPEAGVAVGPPDVLPPAQDFLPTLWVSGSCGGHSSGHRHEVSDKSPSAQGWPAPYKPKRPLTEMMAHQSPAHPRTPEPCTTQAPPEPPVPQHPQNPAQPRYNPAQPRASSTPGTPRALSHHLAQSRVDDSSSSPLLKQLKVICTPPWHTRNMVSGPKRVFLIEFQNMGNKPKENHSFLLRECL